MNSNIQENTKQRTTPGGKPHKYLDHENCYGIAHGRTTVESGVLGRNRGPNGVPGRMGASGETEALAKGRTEVSGETAALAKGWFADSLAAIRLILAASPISIHSAPNGKSGKRLGGRSRPLGLLLLSSTLHSFMTVISKFFAFTLPLLSDATFGCLNPSRPSVS